MHRVQTGLPQTVRAPGLARAFLRSALGTWRLDGAGDLTELLASEIVTNAVLHARSPIRLRMTRAGEIIRVEVDDASPIGPVVVRPDETGTGGRGLYLVESLARRWGVELRDDAKTVWFEIDIPEASAAVHDSEPGSAPPRGE